MKILCVGDTHFRASRPISRLDKDFLATLLGKVEAIREISESEGAAIVILLGDVVDRPDAPHSVVIKVNRAFSKFKIPVYTVCGNHDVLAYSGSTVDSTALGSLFEMGSVKRLDTLRLAPSPAEVAEGGRPVSIYGLHAFDKDEWTVPESSDFKILVAHKMITNIVIPGMHCFTLEDVARKTNADVVLSGDIHKPHHETVNGKLMVNPGSLARLSIDDRDREPQVAIITLDADGASCDMRTLPGRPVETLFDLKAYSEKMASRIHKEDFTRTFVQAIVSIKAESTKMDDVLISFLEKNGVGEKMKSLVREYWGRAERDALEEVKE